MSVDVNGPSDARLATPVVVVAVCYDCGHAQTDLVGPCETCPGPSGGYIARRP